MLVTFEGIDGVGKTTQISLLSQIYQDAIITKEPGGTELGAKIRQMLLNGDDISFRAEILLFLADRAEHYEKVIVPNRDRLILSDRGFISGIAYAMANEPDLDIEELLEFNKFALNGDLGDKFIFFKIDKNALLSRLKSRQADNIEARGIEYLLMVQDYMEILFRHIKLDVLYIDASEEILSINEKIKEFIE